MELEKSTLVLEQFPILKEFQDVFLDEMARLPPKRDLDFTIDLMLGSTPVSRAPYCMTTPELTELRMQI